LVALLVVELRLEELRQLLVETRQRRAPAPLGGHLLGRLPQPLGHYLPLLGHRLRLQPRAGLW